MWNTILPIQGRESKCNVFTDKVANNNGIIRSYKSTKDKQHNGQKIKRHSMMNKTFHRMLKKTQKNKKKSNNK